MSQPQNFLQQVQTYQEAGLGYLVNEFGIVANTNSKYREFNKLANNLGSTVTFDLTPRFTTTQSLVANYQPAIQRVERLTVDKQENISFQFSTQQMIFNIDPMNYMKNFGMAAIKRLGNSVESSLATDFITSPYRFYGNGSTPLDSFTALAKAEAFFREYGAADGVAKGFLPNLTVPQVVGTGLNQFVPGRNETIAKSWELGEFSNTQWIRSNLLQKHIAGTEGQQGTTLTVYAVNRDADNNIISIEFSGTNAASDTSSVLAYDRFQMMATTGYETPFFLNFIGAHVSNCPVQFQAASSATSSASSRVIVTLKQPVYVGESKTTAPGISTNIIPGMTAKVLPSHIAGVMYSGDAHMFAMPQMDDVVPYPTATKADDETGIAIRQYYGAIFGQNVQTAMIYDCIWGSKLIPEYAMAVIFPYNGSFISL